MTQNLSSATSVAIGLLALAIVVAFVRLARGPSIADRIVALDAIAAAIVGVAILHAIQTGLAVFIDVALAIALLSFLGTVAIAHAIERGAGE